MYNLNLLINAIDFNHNGIIDPPEVEKAKALGLTASEGQPVNTILSQNSGNQLQEALKQIDSSQKVDNKNLFEASTMMNKNQQTNGIEENDNVKRKRLSFYA